MRLALIATVETVRALGLCGVLIVFAHSAAAQNIAVVISEETSAYIEIADGVRRMVEEKDQSAPKIITIPAQRLVGGESEIFKTDFYQLVVTVGAHAANIVAKTEIKAPVLSILIPRALYERLATHGTADGRNSAIYLDQPLSRQLELARIVLPGKTRLCVLYGPQSRAYILEFERLASAKGYRVVAELVDRASDLGPVLHRSLSRCEFLFALPDADIFNHNTIQQILLTTYHSNDPVIAFSAAQVKSGALAAVFTSPEQVARHTAEVILKLHADGKFTLPPPQFPLYWSVNVNRQVARSMGLVIGDDKEIQTKLSKVPEEVQ